MLGLADCMVSVRRVRRHHENLRHHETRRPSLQSVTRPSTALHGNRFPRAARRIRDDRHNRQDDRHSKV